VIVARLPARLRLLRRTFLNRVQSIQLIQAVTQSDAEVATEGLAAIRERSLRARQRAASSEPGHVDESSMNRTPPDWVEQMITDNSAEPDLELGL